MSISVGIATNALKNTFNVAVCTTLVAGIILVEGFSISSRGRRLIARQSVFVTQQAERGQITIIQQSRERAEFFLLKSHHDSGEEAKPKKKKKKKKKKLVLNPILNRDSFEGGGVATISSDGVVDVSSKLSQKQKNTYNLGIPSKRKMKDVNNSNSGKKNKRLSAKALKLQNQRTAGGLVDSSTSSTLKLSSSLTKAKLQNPLEEEQVRIAIGKRGSKVVTMIQGMTLTTMEDRKKLLKALKAKVGGGGTLVEGVLELQGPHCEIAMSFLKSKGYTKAKIVGGGGKGKGKKK